MFYSGCKNYFRARNFKKVLKKYISEEESPKLHVGAGGSILKNWINTDYEHIEKETIFLDASKKFDIPDQTFDFIYAEHLFEHLNIEGQINMLAECKRVLRKGGVLRIATPNLNFLLQITQGGKDDFLSNYLKWASNAYFPKNLSINMSNLNNEVHFLNHYFHNWGHQFIHNPDSFIKLSNNFQYSLITQVNVHVSSYKCFRNIETHGNVIPSQYNVAETMVFELTK